MKKILLTLLLIAASTAYSSVTISGTSLFNSAMNGYETGVFVVSNTASFNESLFSAPASGLSFTAGTKWGDYTVLGAKSVNAAGSNSVVQAGITFDLSSSVAAGNEIGILVFNTSTTSSSAGDSILIFTNNWGVPSDGSNIGITGSAAPYSGAPSASGTVVPEPSTYAMFAGALALGYVMIRRRK